MTRYHEFEQSVTDIASTHGIVDRDYVEVTEYEWVTAMSPTILRQLAELIEFCHGNDDVVEIGLVEPFGENDDAPPALLVGNPDNDRFLMASPRTDGKETGKTDDNNAELGDFDDE